ncbi:hypothetical protein SprV_0602203100 [Sparganum proliferum]
MATTGATDDDDEGVQRPFKLPRQSTAIFHKGYVLSTEPPDNVVLIGHGPCALTSLSDAFLHCTTYNATFATDVVNTLQRASSAGSVTSSSLNLPLCTEEAYENILRRLSVDDGFANEAMPFPNIPVLATALWRYFDGQQSGGFMDHRTGTEGDRHVGGTFIRLQKSPYLPQHAHNYPLPKNRNCQWPVKVTSHPGYEGR